jgi:hypothetical protein
MILLLYSGFATPQTDCATILRITAGPHRLAAEVDREWFS